MRLRFLKTKHSWEFNPVSICYLLPTCRLHKIFMLEKYLNVNYEKVG